MESRCNEDLQGSHTLLKKSPVPSSTSGHFTPEFWSSKRFLVAILLFFGTLLAGSLNANLNIAIVGMTSNRTINLHNQTIVEEAEFKWDSKTIAFLLTICSYGNVLALFGSNLPMKFGGSTMITLTIGSTAVLTLLIPIIIRFNLYLFMFVRILAGICMGIAFLSYFELWSRWAPVQDRSKLMTISATGIFVGIVVIYPVCGFVIHHFGWPAAFYLTGGLSLLWCLLWFTCVTNDPASDKSISKKELKYIQENQFQNKRPNHIMSICKSMLTSKCIWALCVSKFAIAIALNFIIKFLPMYIKDTTNAEIHKIGIFSALPSISGIFAIPLAGYVADYLQNKHILTPTKVHKAFMCTGFAVGAALLFCISSFDLSFTLIMVCVVTIKLMLSLNHVILQVSFVCLAPQCASVVAGIVSQFLVLGSVLSSMFVGFVVSNHRPDQWNLCISLTGTVLLVAAFLFLLWGSAEPQAWAYSPDHGEQSCEEDVTLNGRIRTPVE